MQGKMTSASVREQSQKQTSQLSKEDWFMIFKDKVKAVNGHEEVWIKFTKKFVKILYNCVGEGKLDAGKG